MEERIDVIFEGAVTALTPLSITQHSSATKRFGITISKQPCMTVYEDGKSSERLYIPSSSLRGKLRRAARDVVHRALSEKSAEGWHQFSMPDFQLLTVGGIKHGNSKSAKEKAKEQEQSDQQMVPILRATREKNPLVSLFGCFAPSTVPGRLGVTHLIAQEGIAEQQVNFVRTDDFQRDPESMDMVNDRALEEYREQIGLAQLSSGIKKGKRELKKMQRAGALAEEIENFSAEIASQEDQQTAVKNHTQQLLGMAQIPAGCKMASTFRLMRVTTTELSLFLQALNVLAHNPLLGGHLNAGLGLVKGEWQVKVRKTNRDNMMPAGRVAFAGDFNGLTAEGEVCDYLSADIDWTQFDYSAKSLDANA